MCKWSFVLINVSLFAASLLSASAERLRCALHCLDTYFKASVSVSIIDAGVSTANALLYCTDLSAGLNERSLAIARPNHRPALSSNSLILIYINFIALQL